MEVGSRDWSAQGLVLVWLTSACATPVFTQRSVGRAREQATQRQEGGPRIVRTVGQDPIIPQFECMDFGCPATVRCGKAVCTVTHCGKGSCRFCPAPFPDALKNLFIKEWCAYGCLAGAAQVGTAYGFVPGIGKAFVGPLGCPEDRPTPEPRTATLGEE